LADKGAAVMIADINEKAAETTAAEPRPLTDKPIRVALTIEAE
jgi:hypothetical protein